MTAFEGVNRITSPRGMRTLGGTRKMHNGKDAVPTLYAGQPLDESAWRCRALAAGRVLRVAQDAVRGRYLDVEFAPGGWYRYQHLQSVCVQAGDSVAAGQALGIAGNTGSSTGRHLHYEVWRDGGYIDPDALDGLPNKAGTYGANNEAPGAGQPRRYKIYATTERAVSSQQLDEGVLAVMGGDGVLRGYNTGGEARMARQYLPAGKSAVFEQMCAELQAGEMILAEEG